MIKMWKRGVEHVVFVSFCGGNPHEREHLEDLGIDGRILKWILK
jgi:hypothetical protein